MTSETQVVVVPFVDVSVAGPRPRGGGRGIGGIGNTGKIGGAGNDSKAAAVAFLVLAATALVTAAVIEGSRFDGWAELHPMQPVHLLGRDGGYTVMPLAWIDPNAATWADRAIVRSSEGPWQPLERAPLSRRGLAYGMYGGFGTLRSADGSLVEGPAWTVQLGGFPTQELGILGTVFFAWRDNQYGATLFETRWTAEVQYLPIQLGIFHAGLYGGAGFARRFEDAVRVNSQLVAGDDSSGALVGGAMFQLDFNTRVALTARLDLSYAHGNEMRDVLFGLSVY